MHTRARIPTGFRRGCRTVRGCAAAITLGVSFAFFQISTVEAQDYRLLRLDGVYLKWGSAAFETPARVSYAILKGQLNTPDGINCKRMSGIAHVLARAEISQRDFEHELHAAFALWHEAAGIEFVHAADAAAADIVIGSQARPRGIAYTNVNYALPEEGEIARLNGAAICLNPEADWELESDSDLTTFNLRRVLAHEIGHAIGLNHPGRHGQLMGFGYTTDLAVLMEGDLQGIRSLYGLPSHLSDAGLNTVSTP